MIDRRNAWRSLRPLAVLLGLALVPATSHAQGTAMFPSKGVSDKPQSKVWHHDNSWWAVLNNSANLTLYKLDGATWTPKLDLQPALTPYLAGGTSDVLWTGTNLFVAAFDTAGTKIYKLAYDGTAKTYTPLAGFPVLLDMPLGSETIVIDKDSTGRLWATYEAGSSIWVLCTTTPDHKTWSAPIAIGNNVDPDDISTIVAFGGNSIGVAWSDQRTHRVCFRWHKDASSPTSWQSQEVIVSGWGVVDDHLCMKADSQGRVYIGAKDYFDKIYVARRERLGGWTLTTNAGGLDCGTRPILQIDEGSGKLYVFYTRWAECVSKGTHSIEERVSDLQTLRFSLPTVLIGRPGLAMNNVQGCKQPLPSGSMLVVCDGGGSAYWRGWGPVSNIGGADPGGAFPPPPSAPTGLSGTEVMETPSPRLMLLRLDDTSSSKATDSSGNGRHAVFGAGLTAPHSVNSGVVGKALFFDRSYMSVSSSSLGFVNQSFTLESWLRPDLTNSPGTGMIFSRGDTLHTNYQLSVTGNLIEFGWSASDTLDVTVKCTSGLRDGAWHHIAAVYDAPMTQARIYVDGKLGASKLLPPPAISGSWTLDIGAVVMGPFMDKTYTGTLDLLAVAGSALYSANFVPPLLYPSVNWNYPRLTWNAVTSVAGISSYVVRRSTNGAPAQLLSGPLGPNLWFADLGAPDGTQLYSVRAIDGLAQESLDSNVSVSFASVVPVVTSPPQGLTCRILNVTADGPAFYEMDEGEGGTTSDGTGLEHVLTLGDVTSGDAAEPAWIPSFSGKALRFDGVDDDATIGDAADLRFAKSFTLEIWLRRNRFDVAQAIVCKGDSVTKRNYGISVLPNGTIEFSWSRSSGSVRKTISTGGITDAAWHHVACVFDALQAKNFIYLDGTPVGSSAVSGTPYVGAEPVRIGVCNSADRFKGDLDLLRISNGIRYSEPFSPPTFYRGSRRRLMVQLSWTRPATGLAVGFRLYRQPAGAGTKASLIASMPTLDFTDTNLSEGSYVYTESALNSMGIESSTSGPLQVDLSTTDASPDASANEAAFGVWPNPFNPQAMVSFHLQRRGTVRLEMFDASGRRVDTLVRGELPAGVHRVEIARPGSRLALASGVYFLRLRADGRDRRIKAILVR